MNWYERFQDLFKREIPKGTDVEAIFTRTDVDQFFSQLNNYYNPSELLRKLGGIRELHKLYKDSEIYAACDKRIAALLDTKMVIEGVSEEQVKFFEEQLLPHERQLKQDLWWSVPYGYNVEQIIYDPDRSCKVIGFQQEEFWRFEPLPDLIHVRVIDTSNFGLMNQVLPYGKWVLTTNNGTYHNPWGDPMFERLIQPWIFRCNGWDLWMDFAKRFANGFMHARIEEVEKVKEVRAALERAGKSAVLVTDKNTEVNMIQASRDSSIYDMIDTKTIATMQKVILGETLTSNMGANGALASTIIHNEVRLEKTRADIKLVEAGVDEIIKQIAAVCGITDIANLPKCKLIYDPGLNAELANRDQVLTNSGVKFNKKYYVNNYGLNEDEFEIVDLSQPSFGGFSADGSKKKTFLSPEQMRSFVGMGSKDHKCAVHLAPDVARKSNRQQNEKEDVVAFLNRNAEPPINVEDLIAAITNSENKSQLEKNLTALFDTRSSGFVDAMTEALYYSAGRGAMLGNPEVLPSDEE